MKRWKRLTTVCVACAVLAGSMPVLAETEQTNALPDIQKMMPDGQKTLEDLDALNGGKAKVYSHNGRVTFVDGTCTESSVTDEKDAAAVVDSVMTLIGASADTVFIPWRTVTDPLGNHYYIFQQMYEDTTVCGGAVKVVTDAGGKMIALSSSVESEMPDVDPGKGITAEEAEKIAVEKEHLASGQNPEALSQYTGKVILPSQLKLDIESTDETSRFAWVVYTKNFSGNVQIGSDLPYLAHYVSMSGEYLYNMPAIIPDDEAGRAGYDSSYIFEFMEPAEYTGYVDLSDGSEKEITVTVMRDKRTGMYYLGNIERRIIVGECYDFLYNDGTILLEASEDNLEWDQIGLMSLYNYCRAYDYYKEIGWIGGDGEQTPILILNNFCDDHYIGVNNACYIGKYYGMQCFAASSINDYSQCLDIIAHEFTHCVTHSLMTYNSYMNDYGAINEAMSDIQGKNCAMMAGDSDAEDWVIGSHSVSSIRSMSDPHLFMQPEYTWDLYYMANAQNPGTSNDHGGVHFNSSLLNRISNILISEGGMSLDEARIFWFMTDCIMVPQTDYEQLAEILPWVLKTAGMEKYAQTLEKAIGETRLGDKSMPEKIGDDRALVTISLPDTEAFDTGNWMMTLTNIKVDQLIARAAAIFSQVMNKDFSAFPESVRELIEEGENKKKEAGTLQEPSEGFFAGLLKVIQEVVVKEKTEQPDEPISDEHVVKVMQDLEDWLMKEVREVIFSSMGFAGQDGSTLNMIVRPGRTVPILQHVTIGEASGTPDQIVLAVYVNGKWYDLGISQYMETKEGNGEMPDMTAEIIKVVCGENGENLLNIKNLDDFLDLFTIEIKEGEKLELSSNGLETIVIPEPTPEEEKEYGKLEPGKKSRPKLTAEEADTEAAGEDKAA